MARKSPPLHPQLHLRPQRRIPISPSAFLGPTRDYLVFRDFSLGIPTPFHMRIGFPHLWSCKLPPTARWCPPRSGMINETHTPERKKKEGSSLLEVSGVVIVPLFLGLILQRVFHFLLPFFLQFVLLESRMDSGAEHFPFEMTPPWREMTPAPVFLDLIFQVPRSPWSSRPLSQKVKNILSTTIGFFPPNESRFCISPVSLILLSMSKGLARRSPFWRRFLMIPFSSTVLFLISKYDSGFTKAFPFSFSDSLWTHVLRVNSHAECVASPGLKTGFNYAELIPS